MSPQGAPPLPRCLIRAFAGVSLEPQDFLSCGGKDREVREGLGDESRQGEVCFGGEAWGSTGIVFPPCNSALEWEQEAASSCLKGSKYLPREVMLGEGGSGPGGGEDLAPDVPIPTSPLDWKPRRRFLGHSSIPLCEGRHLFPLCRWGS